MKFKIKPEDFDWLGFGTFTYLLVYGIYILKTGNVPSTGWTYLLIVIAVLGLLIDGTIVYKYFLKKN